MLDRRREKKNVFVKRKMDELTEENKAFLKKMKVDMEKFEM